MPFASDSSLIISSPLSQIRGKTGRRKTVPARGAGDHARRLSRTSLTTSTRILTISYTWVQEQGKGGSPTYGPLYREVSGLLLNVKLHVDMESVLAQCQLVEL